MLAIKQVPVDTDLQEIIKEISIMQQCDSPYIVKYYGSYFKNTDLWVSFLHSDIVSLAIGFANPSVFSKPGFSGLESSKPGFRVRVCQ